MVSSVRKIHFIFRAPEIRLSMLFTLFAALLILHARADHHLEVVGSKSLIINCWVSADGRVTDKTAQLYLPSPPARLTQTITSLRADVPLEKIEDQSEPPRELLRGSVEGELGDDALYHYGIHLCILARIDQRQLMEGAGTHPKPLTSVEERRWLRSTPTVNWEDSRLLRWLDQNNLRRTGEEKPLDYARRLYEFLRREARYQYPPASSWDGAATCGHLHSDCGGLSAVFVSACRANQIPSRLLIGQWFRTSIITGRAPGTQPHVYAEIFDPEVGWTPIDIASALISDKDPHSKGDSFGMDPPFFLVLTYDTDFLVVTPRDGLQKVEWMQNPNLWLAYKGFTHPTLDRRWSYQLAASP